MRNGQQEARPPELPHARRPARARPGGGLARCLTAGVLLATVLASAALVDALAGGAMRDDLMPRISPGGGRRASVAEESRIPPQALYLVRSTLSALSDASRTGNYSVLRDLAAPSFQAANSPADLALLFQELRHKNIDLASALTATPELTGPAVPDASQSLRLRGRVPAAGQRILFDLLFEDVAGHWRLNAISVASEPLATEAPAPAAPPPRAARP